MQREAEHPRQGCSTQGVRESPPGCRGSISISWRGMSCIIAAQLGLRRWTQCCSLVSHLAMALPKHSVIFFASSPSVFRTDRSCRAPFGSSGCLLSSCPLSSTSTQLARGPQAPVPCQPEEQSYLLCSKPASAARPAPLLLALRDLANALSNPFCFPAA